MTWKSYRKSKNSGETRRTETWSSRKSTNMSGRHSVSGSKNHSARSPSSLNKPAKTSRTKISKPSKPPLPYLCPHSENHRPPPRSQTGRSAALGPARAVAQQDKTRGDECAGNLQNNGGRVLPKNLIVQTAQLKIDLPQQPPQIKIRDV
jgi:hypothetical protein